MFNTKTILFIYLKIKLSDDTELSANTVIISLFFITASEASEGERAVRGEAAFNRTPSNFFRHL